MFPKYHRYQGNSWHVVPHGEHQHKLWIIGFQNRHSLRMGNAIIREKLDSGEMQDDTTPHERN